MKALVFFLATLAAVTFAADEPTHPAPARTHGWSWKTPPDQVNPDSGKRSNVFYVGEAVTFKLGPSALTYEVRDFWGAIVDKGAAAASITIKATTPGWYKLYLYGKGQDKDFATKKEEKDIEELGLGKPAKGQPLIDRSTWADVVGGTTFVIFRNNANFPPLPDRKEFGGDHYPSTDQPMRAVTGMGPQRHSAGDTTKPDECIKKLAGDIEVDKKLYLPFDPLRKRQLMIAFPNGLKDMAGAKKIVEAYKADVKYFEPRNEPNFGSSGKDFCEKEMKPFYEMIKSIDPELKVMGPGTVSIGPQLLPWIEDFLKAGGAKYIDVFSFHCYNGVNGDMFLARKSLDELNALLARYGADKKEKWQTEQGYFCCTYGAYQPHLQARWEMTQMMVYEQYGIPKEHNHLWYDKSHGFWDVPTWWENDDGSLNPAGPLMRVWSEELFATNYAKAYDFGPIGNRMYIGSLFSGPDKNVAAFMSAGSTDGKIELVVSGGDKIHVVSAFGVEQDISVVSGKAMLPVPELPVYVELAKGQTIDVLPFDWGANLAMAPGVSVAASGTGTHPNDKTLKNDPIKIHNGEQENWYYAQAKDAQPWMDDTKEFPAWVEMKLPEPKTIERVVVYAAPPWQSQSTLQDYELQYDDNGKWVTIEHVVEPLNTINVFTPPTRTSVDVFFSDRWVFIHNFKPVTTQKIRLFVHNTTWGGGTTKEVTEAGGQTGPHQIVLREVEIYGPPDPVMATPSIEPSRISSLATPVKMSVNVLRHDAGAFSGKVVPHLPAGWTASPDSLPVSFEKQGDRKLLQFTLTPGKDGDTGSIPLGVDVLDASGKKVNTGGCGLELRSPIELSAEGSGNAEGTTLKVTLKNVSAEAVKGTLTVNGSSGDAKLNESKPFETAAGASSQIEVSLKALNISGKIVGLTSAIKTESGIRTELKQTMALTPYRYVGPFSHKDKKGFAAVYPPETELDFTKTYPTEDGPNTWKRGCTSGNGFFDFSPCFKKRDWVVAYAVTYVNSPVDQEAVLSCGSDDGIKAWFNGKEVIADNAERGAAPGQDKAKIALKKGWNTALVKITQGGYGWGFYLSVENAKGEPIEGLRYADTME